MNLKKLRQEENLTQEDVAKIINKSAVAYGYYESGRNEPDLKTLCKLADFYKVSIDYIIGRQYNNQVGYIPDNRKELVKEIIELSDADAKEVQIFLKGYKAGKSGTSEFSIFN